MAPSPGRGTLEMTHASGAKMAVHPQLLTYRNIEQWAAMTVTEDTLLGGIYVPTICTLTTTTTVPFKLLIVPTETSASIMKNDSAQGSEGEFESENDQGVSLEDDESEPNYETEDEDDHFISQDVDQIAEDELTRLTKALAITPITVDRANKEDTMDNPLLNPLGFSPSIPIPNPNAFHSSPYSPPEIFLELTHPSSISNPSPVLPSSESKHIDPNSIQSNPAPRHLPPPKPDADTTNISTVHLSEITSLSDLVDRLNRKNGNNGYNGYNSISNSSTSSVPTSPTSPLPSTSTAYTSTTKLSPLPQAAAKPKKVGFLQLTYNRIVRRQSVKLALPHVHIDKYDAPPSTSSPDLLNDESAPSLDASPHRQVDASFSSYLCPPHPPQESSKESPIAKHNLSQREHTPYPAPLSLASDITRVETSSEAIEAADKLTFETPFPSTGNIEPDFPWPKPGSRFSDYSDVGEAFRFNVLTQVQAWLDYPGNDLDDLPLKAGDVIDVVEYLNDDYWRGVITTRNVMGIFPTAYVRSLDPPANGIYPTLVVKISIPTSSP
ncbi:hypothetical protein BKA57DRAFT_454066 [Linnemannia elongata]|nr:hypothetical protein BKA57DRAFT_454066 [Linnemannia elongata]